MSQRPEVDQDPPATGGGERPRMLVGLGNPGERYAGTRHNLGFMVIAELARRYRVELREEECRSRLAAHGSVRLIQPQTFMNRSGHAVRCLRERHGLEPEDFLIIYDEIHLPLGKLRLRPRGSPAGHRGLESVLESLGSDQVPRLRLGIAGEEGPRHGEELVEFVLSPFAAEERETVAAMISRAADACEAWSREGAEAAMQRFNG